MWRMEAGGWVLVESPDLGFSDAFKVKNGDDGFGGNKPDGGWVMGCMEGRMGMLFK